MSESATTSSHSRAFPNACPYCGDDNLWPHEPAGDPAAPGAWECRSCLRAFSLRMLGQIARPGRGGSLT